MGFEDLNDYPTVLCLMEIEIHLNILYIYKITLRKLHVFLNDGNQHFNAMSQSTCSSSLVSPQL